MTVSIRHRRGFIGLLTGLALMAGGHLGARMPPSPSEYNFVLVRALAGPVGGETGDDLSVAPDGTVFVAGYHSGLDVDRDGEVELPAFGGTDPLTVKLESTGADGLWISAAAGPGKLDAASGVAPDGEGGAWVVGRIQDEAMRFSDTIKIRTRGETDGFLAHYDGKGGPVRVIVVGGTGADTLSDVAVDPAGNVVVVGAVRGAVDVDRDGKVDVEGSPEGSLLVASFHSEGKLRWARAFSRRGGSAAQGVVIDADGTIFLTGNHRGPGTDLDGDGRADLPPRPDGFQGFFARLDAEGRLTWVRAPAGAFFGHLTQAPNGDLLVLGRAEGALDLDGDRRPDVAPRAAGPHFFLARYNHDGALLWARTFAQGSPVDVAAHGRRIALAGFFKGPLDLDGDGRIDARGHTDGVNDGMLAVLGDDGELLEVWGVIGISYDQVRAVGFSPDGASIYTTGFVQRTADFDGDGLPEGDVKCDSYGDIFFARYDCTLEVEVALEDAKTGSELSVEDASGALLADGARIPLLVEGHRLVARLDHPGTFTVRVTKPGYVAWEKKDVGVARTDCRDRPLRLSIEVRPTASRSEAPRPRASTE